MRVLRTTATGVALALASAVALFAATPAAAQTYPNAPGATPPYTYTTFYFTAPCEDCTDAYGVLTLANYVTGELMGNSHFVDFTYTSSKLNFEITAADLRQFRAVFTTVPGENFVQILGPAPPPTPGTFAQPGGYRQFETDPAHIDANPDLSRAAGWYEMVTSGSTLPAGGGGDVAPDDFGTDFTWSDVAPATVGAAVPEPAGWVLMITGFALAGASLRAARRSSAAA
jgi:hypothetical protein